MDFDKIIKGIRTALYGREVREYIARAMEWVRDFVNASIATIRELLRQAEAARDAAKQSEANAKVSETNAKNSENNAKASENAARASQDAAKASENAAKTSEVNAKTSETNAKTSADNAKVSETNAKASETNAKESETNAEDYMNAAMKAVGEKGWVWLDDKENSGTLYANISNNLVDSVLIHDNGQGILEVVLG